MQLYHILVDAIRNGTYESGQKMPSLTELSKTIGISRMTVRQALQRLVNEGWLYTVPGKGTFVSKNPRLTQNLQLLRGWTEEITSQGYLASSKLLKKSIVPADVVVAKALQINVGAQVHIIKRQRFADNVLMGMETAYLAFSHFPDLDVHLMNKGSLYQVLKDHYAIRLVRAVQEIDAIAAGHLVASELEMNIGDPVLLMRRTTFMQDDSPVEYVISMYKPGFVHFKSELLGNFYSSPSVVIPPFAHERVDTVDEQSPRSV